MEEPYVHKLFIEKVEQDAKENIWLSKHGFAGEIADPDRAVFTYPIKHSTDLETIDMGAMGENFAVLEMDEFTICIGDTFQIGDAIIQVSQPYQPYWNQADREFAKNIQESGRTGWYFRVLQEGNVKPETDMELIEQPYPQWSIAACNEVMFVYKEDLRLTDDLLSCDLLAEMWKRPLHKRLGGRIALEEKMIYGQSKV